MGFAETLRLPKGLSITFLGHASFRVVTEGGKTVLIDPWLTGNPVLPESEKRLDKADLILVTHGHRDHLDPLLVGIAERAGAKVASVPAVLQFLQSKGFKNGEFINKGGTISVSGLKVTMTHALHSSSIELENGVQGYPHEASGFVLETESGFRIYFAGDTGIFTEMALIGEIYQPDLAVLPIGDRATMGPLEASYATHLLEVKQVIPCHYKTFPMLTGTAEAFVEELGKRELGDVAVRAMEPGETISG